MTPLDAPVDDTGLSARTARNAVVAAAAVALVLGSSLGFFFGQQHPAMHHAEVRCMSAPGAISCSEGPDYGAGVYGISKDVHWTDADGVFHSGSRPECLPPTGRGLTRTVGITWVTAEVDGTSWRHVVGVHCR